MNFREKSVMFFATGCFIGNIPFAPGTFGTILGLPFCFFLSRTNFLLAVLLTGIFIIFAIFIAHHAEKILKKNDPGLIVIDEIAGFMITILNLPFNAVYVLVGFVMFRFFDILKPFPIRLIERKLSGGTAIVMDDVAAGIYSNLVLRIILYLSQ
ncbi:MAG: phosphatidylglycerophosphatase A [Desulfobacterales bacterium]|nr:phosphatidylglycerophosphatase A [Desulfobacterales bacterium]